MKKLLLSIASFSGLSMVFYLVLVIAWGLFAPRVLQKNMLYKMGAGFTFLRIQDIKKSPDIDILCIGSSHCYRGYDPRIFQKLHLQMYNLGTSAQTPLQTELLLKEYFDRLKPKFVILDIYPPVFGNDGVESTLNLIANDSIDKPLIGLAFGTKNIKVFNTLIYGLFRQSLGLNAHYHQSPVIGNDTYIDRGYVQTFKQYSSYKTFKSQKVSFDSSQLEAFKRIVLFLKSRGTPYVIVQAPVTHSNFMSYTNNQSIDSLMAGMGPYINANYFLNLPDSFFMDDHHLNQLGVNIFDPMILHLIDSLGLKR